MMNEFCIVNYNNQGQYLSNWLKLQLYLHACLAIIEKKEGTYKARQYFVFEAWHNHHSTTEDY